MGRGEEKRRKAMVERWGEERRRGGRQWWRDGKRRGTEKEGNGMGGEGERRGKEKEGDGSKGFLQASKPKWDTMRIPGFSVSCGRHSQQIKSVATTSPTVMEYASVKCLIKGQ